ncbi:lysine decarboxylation/transport transcriptional activator CadC [Vibrio sp. J1-1]|uniref:lysine decarboxylation/transport transcriptional activator CadC n=1 Tax=Vibrio sp. J1-1 TaxID=2912251 RepID=UPI001F027FCA|nr:lysine decarboxylation/transport transcriptional activator CadC [Vibrio sp. J1-1]MCF7484161.1 lysine decarboxylation/transport transcriptional activator CadC [Vibrio sp. J1-1]
MVGVYFQINDWVMDVGENKLYRKGRETSVEPRLSNLLYFFAKNANQVFTRKELIQSVWDRAAVTDQVVTQSISELRKLLRDSREENPSYVITVPKRGYKLVAEVTRLTPKEFMRVSSSDSQNMPSLTGEAARFYSDASGGKFKLKHQGRYWSKGLFSFTLLGIVVAMIVTFTYKQPEVSNRPNNDIYLIEFTLHNNASHTGIGDDLADGITKKLMSDVAQVSDYRVMQKRASFNSRAEAGKSVVVKIRQSDVARLLEIEYRTSFSDKALFRRLYTLADRDLKTVLQQASLGMMTILNVPDAKLKSTMLVAGLPITPKALKLFIQAHHYLNISDENQYQHGIELMENVLDIEPHNAYVQAELLIAYHVQKALHPEQAQRKRQPQALYEALEVGAKMAIGQIQPRIYEALALHKTVVGDLAKAKQYLAQALKLRDSVLSNVIRGKHAELEEDIESAGTFYRQALYIDRSLKTHVLCKSLVFKSDVKVDDTQHQVNLLTVSNI